VKIVFKKGQNKKIVILSSFLNVGYSSTFNILCITSYITNHLCNQWWRTTKRQRRYDTSINSTSNSAAAVLQARF
jgi:hypothetical protein